MSTQNQDLQTFFNNFHKEIEDGNSTVVTLTSENVADITDGDSAVQKILMDEDEDDEENDNASDGNTTYYLDEEGNCFIQKEKSTPKRAVKTKQIKKIQIVKANAVAIKKLESRRTRSSAKADYGQMKTEIEDVIEELVGEASTNDSGEIYNFEEDQPNDSEENASDSDFVITKKVIKLKPATSTSKSGNNNFACKQCNYTTDKRAQLQRHERSHSDDRRYMCSVCEKSFKSNATLVNHINVHLGKRPHQCKKCTRCFTTSSELIRHVRYKHTGEKPHKCSECAYASVELSKLRRHIRCHTGERPFQCPHCTYASPDTFKLKRHLRTHTGEKPYECDICKARFTQSNSLKSHRLIHSVVDKPVFQCTLCPTTCGRKSDLRLHMQNLHQSEKPIPCKRCGKELPDRYSYKLHIKSHEGERCYRCEMCPYASISQRHLESHMLLHTDEKPFKCKECDLDFRQRQLLRRHINLYHNKDYVPPEPREKIHSCPACKRTFTHKGNLMRHMEIHDPTSKSYEANASLKKGRNLRFNSDGTIITLEDKDNDDIVLSDHELNIDDFIEEESEILEDKLTNKFEATNSNRTNTKESSKNETTLKIKKEPANQEILAVEVDGEEEYMVLEVVDCDEDDEDIESAEPIVVKEENASTSKVNENNCFGFELDEDEDDNFMC